MIQSIKTNAGGLKGLLLAMLLSPIVLVLPSAAASVEVAPSGNLSKTQTDSIIQRFKGQSFRDFGDFCLVLFHTTALFSRDQSLAIGDFTAGEKLTGTKREVIFRLLGIYSQLKYGGDALRSLDGLIALPTVARANKKKQNSKVFKKTAKRLRAMAKRFGLRFQNVDHRVYEISFPQKRFSGTQIGLHTHVDVAPAREDNWMVDGDINLPPFELSRIGEQLYGRGVQHNKNAIVAAMYAMRVIVEEDINLLNSVTLLIRTDGEADSRSMPLYLAKRSAPEFNIALDGSYPLSVTGNTAYDNSQVHHTFVAKQSAVLSENWRRALLMIASENMAVPPKLSRDQRQQESPEWAKPLRNRAQFGLTNPRNPRTDHQRLEQKNLEQFLLDLQMVTEMVARLGQMRELK